jgi:hypothetical protein
VHIIGTGREGGILETEGVVISGVLGVLGAHMVYRIDVFWITQMDFVGCDSNDGACISHINISIVLPDSRSAVSLAIFLMQFANLCIESASIHEAEIGLVEEGQGRELGAWDTGKRVKEEPIAYGNEDACKDKPHSVQEQLR